VPRDEKSTRTRFLRGGPDVTWSDERLVQACLDGNEEAWAALIAKYQNLIYSIPRKYGASPEDAADVFQSVCVELFNELPKLRQSAALRGWLATVTAHQAFHWKRKYRRRAEQDLGELDDRLETNEPLSPALLVEVEREQMVREAVARLSPRCQEIIKLLFYDQPPLAYRDLAKRLGLATGSIGFIRGRCLQHLQRALDKAGF
jgi:RNA polymerase sigma factor (sigma-70 family)